MELGRGNPATAACTQWTRFSQESLVSEWKGCVSLFSILMKISTVFIQLLFSHSVMSNSLDPMDCSMPGFSVLHYLLQFA